MEVAFGGEGEQWPYGFPVIPACSWDVTSWLTAQTPLSIVADGNAERHTLYFPQAQLLMRQDAFGGVMDFKVDGAGFGDTVVRCAAGRAVPMQSGLWHRPRAPC